MNEDLEDHRHFRNPFQDYSASIQAKDLLDAGGQKLNPLWDLNIRKCLTTLTELCAHGLENDIDSSDHSVYTGTTGIALLFFRMWDKLDRRQENKYLLRAVEWIEPALKRLKGKRSSFLCGDAGPLACGAVFYHFLGMPDISQQCIQDLTKMCEEVVQNAEIPDELLFGRAGYLYALLFIRHYIGDDAIDNMFITKVVSAIVISGTNLSRHKRSQCPLLYAWHGSYYMGAAHGLSGIYFMLMRTGLLSKNEDLKKAVKECIDFLVTCRFPSGNYPSSLGKERDELVHWCHGAPGFILMFIEAYKVYGDETYLKEAKSCADVIWKRGLLKKGYGICHGPAGNGYGFLHLYQLTQDIKYLYRALKFAEWMFNYGNHGARVADRPYSLFEGMAGALYYLVDILHPNEAAFPAFYY